MASSYRAAVLFPWQDADLHALYVHAIGDAVRRLERGTAPHPQQRGCALKRLLRTLMLLLVRLFGAPGAILAARRARKPASSESPGRAESAGRGQARPLLYTARHFQSLELSRTITAPRILLIRPDHLGDVLLTTPALHVLKKHVP